MNGSITISGDSLFCMEEDDFRLQPMCCHYLSDSPCNDILLGAEECTSPFGTYEISMPIDENAPCQASSSQITDKNCKDFDVSFSFILLMYTHVSQALYQTHFKSKIKQPDSVYNLPDQVNKSLYNINIIRVDI